MNRYIVVADQHGKLSVTVRDGFEPRQGDTVLHYAHTVDDAFDWKQDMEARIARESGAHCASCG